MRASGPSHRIEVQSFLILERLSDSKNFRVSVLLQADGQSIGKHYLGTVAEGQEILLSLRWDQPRLRFVATSQTAGGAPILSFIPFASPRTANDIAPEEFSMEKFVPNSGNNRTEAQDTRATEPTPRTSVH